MKLRNDKNFSLRSFFRPGSIFFQIFAWFCLAMSLISVTLLVLTFTAQAGPLFEMYRREIGSSLTLLGKAAASISEREGTGKTITYLTEMEKSSHACLYFLDDSLQDIAGRTAPEPAAELALRSRKSGKVEMEFFEGMFLAAQSVAGPGGEHYAAVRHISRGPLQALLDQIHALGIKLLIFLILGIVLCCWLASYLSTPILKLQKAAQKAATGDLSVRVSEAIGKKPSELAALAEDFDRMTARIETLLKAQRRLLRDISHELRSPLARLKVALEIVRRKPDPETADFLDRMERETDRLNELIGQLLDLERLEAETGLSLNESFDLSDLVHEIASDASFEARNDKCCVHMAHSEPLPIRGSRELLRSALENVVRNALRHTKHGSEVEISLSREDRESKNYALVMVRDHGPGVPEEALTDLFRPFFRVQDARERTSGGTGLGLTITERAVRLHGGSISACNAEGGGLIVQMKLPLS
ncbi:ATP-binding protein [Desulfoferrobacter suflitae]|uniref:ATP-binding protein n=1 Tax=Desulfoferrobacter suflitae TaxID=2865782 RepID=UPI002164EEC9|nr:ATP-binding protein [Desulfoferrobacter suflitae]MCK8600125.1 ATP-binding protein [Desulfoferrobacter suflitae]